MNETNEKNPVPETEAAAKSDVPYYCFGCGTRFHESAMTDFRCPYCGSEDWTELW